MTIKYEDIVSKWRLRCKLCKNYNIFITYSKESPDPYETEFCEECNHLLKQIYSEGIDRYINNCPKVLNKIIIDYLL